LTNPKLSIPKTLTRYGKVINGNIMFMPCNNDRDKKFSIRLFLSFDELNSIKYFHEIIVNVKLLLLF
jgi:hypothetical protein